VLAKSLELTAACAEYGLLFVQTSLDRPATPLVTTRAAATQAAYRHHWVVNPIHMGYIQATM
jgi:hypothetical protein